MTFYFVTDVIVVSLQHYRAVGCLYSGCRRENTLSWYSVLNNSHKLTVLLSADYKTIRCTKMCW